MADPALAISSKSSSGGPGTLPVEVIIVQKPLKIEKDRVFVNPPMARIGSGASKLGSIRFVNETDDIIRLWLPNAHHYLDMKPEDLASPFVLEKGGQKDFNVKVSPEPGHYPYHVYCDAIGNGAEGHSEPHV